jgi:hypothetical protein
MSFHPAAAWNGREFLVSWGHETTAPVTPVPVFPPPPTFEILGARVASDGRLIDTTPRSIVGGLLFLSTVATASNGDDFYVVWTSNVSVDPSPGLYAGEAVYGIRVSGDGTTTGYADRLSQADNFGFQLAVAAQDGGDYLVAWTEFNFTDSPVERLEVRFVGKGIRPLLTVNPTEWLDSPAIAASDAGAVIAYDASRTQPPYNGVSRIFTRTVAPPPSSRRRPR